MGIEVTYSENDLESAILKFLLETGRDFPFAARQKKITISGEDYYIDLLFFHRELRRLIALELGKFKASYKERAAWVIFEVAG